MRTSLSLILSILTSWCLQHSPALSAETFKHVTLYTSQITGGSLVGKATELAKVSALSIKKAVADSGLSTRQLELLGRYCPHITSLDLSNSGASDAHMKLLGRQFPKLKTLDVSSLALSDTGFKALSSSVFASRLTALTLSYTKLTSTGFSAGLNRFTSLKNLIVFADGGSFKDPGFNALSGSPCASKLTELILYGTGITDQGFRNSIAKFTSLTSLNLTSNNLGNGALAALANTRFASKLTILTLDNNVLTDAGFIAPVLRKFSGLRSLSVAGSARAALTSAGFKTLAQAPFAGQLTHLGLRATGINSKDFEYIHYFKSLTSLDISKTAFTDAGLRALAQAPCAEHLISLKLGLGISSLGFSAAINSFRNLMSLDISHNVIGDRGFKALSDAPCAGKLITLIAYKTHITRASLAYLKNFTRLKNINIGGNSLEDTGLTALATSSLASQIITLYASEINLTESSFIGTAAALNRFTQLANLDLSYNTIKYQGFEILSKAKFASKLQNLILKNIGSKEPLVTSPLLKNFKQLQKASF